MSQTQPSTKPRHFKKLKPKKEDISFGKKTAKKEKPLKQKNAKKESSSLASDKVQPKEQKKDKFPKTQFPRISRIIPDSTSLKLRGTVLQGRFGIKAMLKLGLVGILIIVALLFNWWALSNLLRVGKNWLAFIENRHQLSQEMHLWESITKEYPQYRDAYVEGALYAYRLGDRQKEQYFLTNLQLLDPNFPLTKTLEQLMNLQITAGN